MFSRIQKNRVAIIIAAILGALVSSASAQNWQGAPGFQLGFPAGEYKDQIDKTGVGISGEFLYSPTSSPVGIGVSLGFMQVGDENRREPFSTTVPDVTVEVNTSNNLAQFMLLLRLQPKWGPILPYADGLLGMNYLYTETTIKNASNDEEVASSTNLDDDAFAYGFGGGLMIKAYDKQKSQPDSKPVQVFIDLGARYILGGEADYLKEGSIAREGGQVTYDVTTSKTNITTAHIGVAINF